MVSSLRVNHFLAGLIFATAFAWPGVAPAWEAAAEDDEAHVRHESSFVEAGGKFYLLGGRRIQPVDIFDPASGEWTSGSPPPIELHHFQAVSHGGLVYIIGAMTGKYPGETPTEHIHIYDPASDQWRRGATIPEDRRRGSAGVVVHEGAFYIVAGIRNGHRSGWVPWLDRYDPASSKWQVLPDAPRARDHFHAAVANGSLYAAGGRRSGSSRPVFAGEVAEVDVYEFSTRSWNTLPASSNLPTLRAGTLVSVIDERLIVMGGESAGQKPAHGEVEALDPVTLKWDSLPSLLTPRHGAQALQWNGAVWIAGGSGNRGGGPELVSLERWLLD